MRSARASHLAMFASGGLVVAASARFDAGQYVFGLALMVVSLAVYWWGSDETTTADK